MDITNLNKTAKQPEFNQDEWMYKTMVGIVGGKTKKRPMYGYRLEFVECYKNATDEQRVQFLKETKFSRLYPNLVERTARRWDKDPFQGLPARGLTRSDDVESFLVPKETATLDMVTRYGLGSDLIDKKDLVYGVLQGIFNHEDIVSAQSHYKKATFDQNALAREYGSDYGIKQKKGESDYAYRSRLAGELKRQGKIIEAHEAFSGRKYDDPKQGQTGPMSGILGAVAQAMQGKKYSPYDPEQQIGDDIAAGVFVRHERGPADNALAAIFGLLGPSAGMDLIDAMHKKSNK